MADEKKAPELDPKADINEFLQSIGDDAVTVSIYRWDPDEPSPWVYLGKEPWEGFTVDRVQRRYGGGRFSIRVYGPPTTERKGGWIGQREVAIAGPRKNFSAEPPPAVVNDEGQYETPEQRERRRADEFQKRVHELELQSMEQRFTSFREEVLGLLRELRAPPPAAESPRASALLEALEVVKSMQTMLVPHTSTPLPNGRDLLEVWMQGLNMGRELDRGEEPHGYDLVLSRTLPLLERLLSGQPAVGAPGVPEPTPGAPAVEGAPVPIDNLEAALKPHIPTFVKWAEKGSDPAFRAFQVVEDLPDRWREDLAEMLQHEGGGAITKILAWYPTLQPHRAWAEAFVEALREDLLGDDESETLTGQEAEAD